MAAPKTPWPHAPLHQLSQAGTYFVTASTYQKQHHFGGAERLAVLHRGLLSVARDFGWHLEAWAVFSNHYHFIGHSSETAPDAANLSQMLGVLHTKTARWVNGLDNMPNRQVWFNFRETRLTYQKSYLARLTTCIRTGSSTGSFWWRISIPGVRRVGSSATRPLRWLKPSTDSASIEYRCRTTSIR